MPFSKVVLSAWFLLSFQVNPQFSFFDLTKNIVVGSLIQTSLTCLNELPLNSISGNMENGQHNIKAVVNCSTDEEVNSHFYSNSTT